MCRLLALRLALDRIRQSLQHAGLSGLAPADRIRH